jgi:hypothetical protein
MLMSRLVTALTPYLLMADPLDELSINATALYALAAPMSRKKRHSGGERPPTNSPTWTNSGGFS